LSSGSSFFSSVYVIVLDPSSGILNGSSIFINVYGFGTSSGGEDTKKEVNLSNALPIATYILFSAVTGGSGVGFGVGFDLFFARILDISYMVA
jgi:hypothetical protein